MHLSHRCVLLAQCSAPRPRSLVAAGRRTVTVKTHLEPLGGCRRCWLLGHSENVHNVLEDFSVVVCSEVHSRYSAEGSC